MEVPKKYLEFVKQYDYHLHRQNYNDICKCLAQAKAIIEQEDETDLINDFNARAAICALMYKQSEEALKLTQLLNFNSPGYLLIQAFRGSAMKNIGYEKRAHDIFHYVLNSIPDTDSVMDSLGAAYSSKFLGSDLSLFFFEHVNTKFEELEGDERTLNSLWAIDALVKKAEMHSLIEQKQKVYLETLNLTQDNIVVYYSLGETYFEQKKYDLALKCYLKSLEINPNYHYFRHIKVSFLYFYMDQEELALQFISHFIKSDKDFQAFFDIICHAIQIKKQDSLSNFEKFYQIGLILYCMKSYSISLVMLDKAKEYDQYNYKLSIFMYVVQRQLGKLTEAIEQLEQVLKNRFQNDVYLMIILSDLYIEISENEKAEEFILNTIKLMPNQTFILYKYVKFLNKMNRLEESLVYIEKAITINPTKIKLLIMKARIYSSLKLLQNAYETYEQILKIQPNQECAKYQLSQINYVLNNYRLAFQQMMNINEGEIGYQDSINILIKIFISYPHELTKEQIEYANSKLRTRLTCHLSTLGDPPKVKMNIDKKKNSETKTQKQNDQQKNIIENQEEKIQEESNSKKKMKKNKINQLDNSNNEIQVQNNQIELENQKNDGEYNQNQQELQEIEEQKDEDELNSLYGDEQDQAYINELFELKDFENFDEKTEKQSQAFTINKQKNAQYQFLKKIREEFKKDKSQVLKEHSDLDSFYSQQEKHYAQLNKKLDPNIFFQGNEINKILQNQQNQPEIKQEEQKQVENNQNGEDVIKDENKASGIQKNKNNASKKNLLKIITPKKGKKIQKKKKQVQSRSKSTLNSKKLVSVKVQTQKKYQKNQNSKLSINKEKVQKSMKIKKSQQNELNAQMEQKKTNKQVKSDKKQYQQKQLKSHSSKQQDKNESISNKSNQNKTKQKESNRIKKHNSNSIKQKNNSQNKINNSQQPIHSRSDQKTQQNKQLKKQQKEKNIESEIKKEIQKKTRPNGYSDALDEHETSKESRSTSPNISLQTRRSKPNSSIKSQSKAQSEPKEQPKSKIQKVTRQKSKSNKRQKQNKQQTNKLKQRKSNPSNKIKRSKEEKKIKLVKKTIRKQQNKKQVKQQSKRELRSQKVNKVIKKNKK